MSNDVDDLNISRSTLYYVDHDNQITFQEILSGRYNEEFQWNEKESVSLGNMQATAWNKFVVELDSLSENEWILILDSHHLDSIVLFTPDQNGNFSTQKSGRIIAYDDRETKFNTYAFQLNIDQGESKEFYLKASSDLLRYPLRIVSYKLFSDLQLRRSITMGILVGFFMMILLYNLVIYRIEWDKNYLFYIIYAFITLVKILGIKGYMDFFWQGPLAYMRSQDTGVTVVLGFSMLLFSVNMLDFKRTFPLANKLVLLICVPPLLLSLVYNIMGNKLYASLTNQVNSIAILLILYILAIIVYIRGYRPARFYIIAVTSMFIAWFIYVFSLLGIFPVNGFTENVIQFGSGLEMLLFSVALGDKLRDYKKAKYQAEKDLLKSLQENERLILDQNRVLEKKVKERTRQLEDEKKKSDELLLNILPSKVAQELKEKGETEAKLHQDVTILFTDFVNFTKTSEEFGPQELVKEVHYCFTAFDEIISRNGLEKIKTIGDAYLAVCGLPLADKEHAIKIIKGALEIQDFVRDYRSSGGPFDIRIGIHSGPIVAGIVGTKKFAYDIWGDTVNMAARMEETSEIGQINISDLTYRLVENHVDCEHRGKIMAKNKGEVDMYFVQGLKTSY